MEGVGRARLLDSLDRVQEHLCMTIEEIVGEVEKAFPGHRGVLLPPKHAAG